MSSDPTQHEAAEPKITLKHWAPKQGGPGRLYIKGLDLLPGQSAWLTKGEPPEVHTNANTGSTSAEIVALVKSSLGLSDEEFTWQRLLLAATTSWNDHKGPSAPKDNATEKARREPRLVTGWTAEDVAALIDIDMHHNPLPEPTSLLVDPDEPADVIAALQTINNLELTLTPLSQGGYMIPGKLRIARKTAEDFIASITGDNGQIFSLTEAMISTEIPACVLLIEDNIYRSKRASLQSLCGTLAYISVLQRVSVVPTLSARHSAMTIARMVRYAVYGLARPAPLRDAGPKDPRAAAAYVLEGIPGLSTARAVAILKHFGSLAAVATADEQLLCEVDGIGSKTASLIAATFRASYRQFATTPQKPRPGHWTRQPKQKPKFKARHPR